MKHGDIIQERYQITGVLGQGSMGTTYTAVDMHTQQTVAVKQLHLARTQEWKTLEMFEREAKILQQLTHPRIPTYIDYCPLDTAEGRQFLLVQEYVEGKTLKQLIEEGWRGTETEILDIFLDLVDILVALHSVCPPVIHRDINPKNIIIAPNKMVSPAINDVYLVDFGAVQEKIRTTFLGGTTVVGTFGYVPFEQFNGQAVPASDYYALGATLLYMLTHRHPSEFPTEELRPQFEPFLNSSSTIVHLLRGLLEPSVKTRIASPEGIKELLDDKFLELSERSASLLKPKQTKIEKVSRAQNEVSFRIPSRQKIGVVTKRTLLHLSPHWVRANEEIFGIHSGELWRVPTAHIQPADITWFFGKHNGTKGQSVMGLNHAGETFEIGSQLSQSEIEWLTQEISEYVWQVKSEDPVVEPQVRRRAEAAHDDTAISERAMICKPPDTPIKKQVKGDDLVSFRIPKVMKKEDMADIVVTFMVCLALATLFTAAAFFILHNNGRLGWIPGGSILMVSLVFWGFGTGLFFNGISRILGSTTLSLSPEWTRISRRCFGIGYSQHIPTQAIQQHDVIRYFQKNKLHLGINYEEKTLKIGSGLTTEESVWLIREITQYVANFAKPASDSLLMADLEMK